MVTYLRLEGGTLAASQKMRFIAAAEESEILEVGYFKPEFKKADKLMAGEIGYAGTGLKNLEHARVGDTITLENAPALSLPGYKEVKPMVFAGIFCKEGDDYQKLREAIEKLKLNDSALFYEPENSPALGFGFRCGFLGCCTWKFFRNDSSANIIWIW